MIKYNIGSILRLLAKSILDYLLPIRCASCSDFVQNQHHLCSSCFKKLHFVSKPYCQICGLDFPFHIEHLICAKCIDSPPPAAISRSLLKYNDDSKRLIYNFKYQDNTSITQFFAKMLFNRYQKDLLDVDIIAPIPMHRLKRLVRLYNPPQTLAEQLSLLIHKPSINDLLIKVKLTKPQKSLTKSQRKHNLKGSIKVNSKYNIQDKTILLVDDVKTTGATLNYASLLLKKEGTKSIKILTVAMA